MPGYCFSKFEVVSGIIWPVISGLDTTATVSVPELLLLPELLPALVPLLEQAASAASAATQPTTPSARSLNRGRLTRTSATLRRGYLAEGSTTTGTSGRPTGGNVTELVVNVRLW